MLCPSSSSNLTTSCSWPTFSSSSHSTGFQFQPGITKAVPATQTPLLPYLISPGTLQVYSAHFTLHTSQSSPVYSVHCTLSLPPVRSDSTRVTHSGYWVTDTVSSFLVTDKTLWVPCTFSARCPTGSVQFKACLQKEVVKATLLVLHQGQ